MLTSYLRIILLTDEVHNRYRSPKPTLGGLGLLADSGTMRKSTRAAELCARRRAYLRAGNAYVCMARAQAGNAGRYYVRATGPPSPPLRGQ